MDRFKVLALSLLGLAFTVCVAISLTYSIPIGWDIWFHLEIARVWARGQNGMFSRLPMTVNRMPYPPLFHLFLVPSIWLNLEILFTRILQTMFYPLILASSMWLTWKHQGKQASIITGVLLMSCVGVFDHGFQLIPQALDLMLLPLAIHAFVQKNKFTFVLVSTLMIYNHGIAAASYVGGLVLLAILEKRKVEATSVISLSLPIIVPMLVYLPPAMSRWGQLSDTLVEIAFWQNPLLLTVWYLGPLSLAIPLAIRESLRFNKLGDFDQATIITLYSLLIMLLPWPDRFLSNTALPLAYLASSRIVKWRHRKILYPLLITTFIVFYSMPWVWLITRDFAIKPT